MMENENPHNVPSPDEANKSSDHDQTKTYKNRQNQPNQERDAHDDSQRERVIFKPLGTVVSEKTPFVWKEWPSGQFIQEAVSLYPSRRPVDDGEKNIDESNNIKSPRNWQVEARRALLQECGFLNEVEPSESMTESDDDEYNEEKIQDIWNKIEKVATSSTSSSLSLPLTSPLSDHTNAKSSSDGADPVNDLLQFCIDQGKSNDRYLEWSLMDCAPGCQFQLHAHPNLELVYCLAGELHEIRLTEDTIPSAHSSTIATDTGMHTTSNTNAEATGSSIYSDRGGVITKDFERLNEDKDAVAAKSKNREEKYANPKLIGPSLSKYTHRPWKFGTLKAGDWLVNRVGTIHKSFTATNGDGCVLLTLWGGSHANIPEEPSVVTKALASMDAKLVDNGNSKNTRSSNEPCTSCGEELFFAETFLPDSERRSKKTRL